MPPAQGKEVLQFAILANFASRRVGPQGLADSLKERLGQLCIAMSPLFRNRQLPLEKAWVIIRVLGAAVVDDVAVAVSRLWLSGSSSLSLSLLLLVLLL